MVWSQGQGANRQLKIIQKCNKLFKYILTVHEFTTSNYWSQKSKTIKLKIDLYFILLFFNISNCKGYIKNTKQFNTKKISIYVFNVIIKHAQKVISSNMWGVSTRKQTSENDVWSEHRDLSPRGLLSKRWPCIVVH